MHTLAGCSRRGSKWVAFCACSWRSVARSLPGQTYVEWLGHREEERERISPRPRVIPPVGRAS